MTLVKNILFIMCDQLRWDYLSCAGHPHLQTPNIDRLAERGVRFDRAFVQSPICGPSRASAYTGRYMSSHGVTYNRIPHRVDELTISDFTTSLGLNTALVGKTHSAEDQEGLYRLQITHEHEAYQEQKHIGFVPYWRDDGLSQRAPDSAYNWYLRDKGYDAENGWSEHANGVVDADGHRRNGFFLKYSAYPADIEEAHSETPYTTRKAMAFIDDMEALDEHPWFLHLSFIKPHWPYIVPQPYHDMFGEADILPRVAEEGEREDAHPLYQAYMQTQASRTFARDETRAAVIPAYMGLVKQIDDQLGALFTFMDQKGLTENTMIVFTSDHGDYLGDHWLGEKSWLHDVSVRVPLIIVDPSPAADSTRGTVNTDLVEMIDLLPTFIDILGSDATYFRHRLEGRSLMPLLHGECPADWRSFAVSEIAFPDFRKDLPVELPQERAKAIMIRTERWKYIYAEGMRPLLYDLEADPNEFNDLGADPAYEGVRAEMQGHLLSYLFGLKSRVNSPDRPVVPEDRYGIERHGIFIGYWDEDDLPNAFWQEIG